MYGITVVKTFSTHIFQISSTLFFKSRYKTFVVVRGWGKIYDSACSPLNYKSSLYTNIKTNTVVKQHLKLVLLYCSKWEVYNVLYSQVLHDSDSAAANYYLLFSCATCCEGHIESLLCGCVYLCLFQPSGQIERKPLHACLSNFAHLNSLPRLKKKLFIFN